MEEIYLDHSATTKPSKASLQKMREALCVCFANPGSVHRAGMAAHGMLEEARRQVAASLGLRRPGDGQICFCSGGTEANNQAIFGTVYAKSRPVKNGSRGKILITDGEHPSVENAAAQLEGDGFTVVRIPTRGGVLDLDYLEKAADASVILAALMLVNNETGALYPVSEAAKILRCNSPGAVIHCDAVQAYMRVPFTPASLGVDTLSVSAHKIYAPKGAGALYISREMIQKKWIHPLLWGGGQEEGLRSGTENVPAIAAFGAAAAEGMEEAGRRRESLHRLHTVLLEKLSPLVQINLPPKGVDAIVNITLPGIKSEVMLRALSARGICVSAGSACSARSKKISRVLLAFGLSEKEADCALRISLSHQNTKEELSFFAQALEEEIHHLARLR